MWPSTKRNHTSPPSPHPKAFKAAGKRIQQYGLGHSTTPRFRTILNCSSSRSMRLSMTNSRSLQPTPCTRGAQRHSTNLESPCHLACSGESSALMVFGHQRFHQWASRRRLDLRGILVVRSLQVCLVLTSPIPNNAWGRNRRPRQEQRWSSRHTF